MPQDSKPWRAGTAARAFFLVGMLAGAVSSPVQAAGSGQCGPSALGAPCPTDGVATQAGAGGEQNLGAGNPIHLVTGNKYQLETDLPARPGVLGVELVRHYNSRGVGTGTLGRNWVWSYDTRLYRVGGSVQIVQADGSRADFSPRENDATTCVAADPALGILHLRPTNRGEIALWQWRDGRVLQFDEDGFLVNISVATGHALTIRRARTQDAHRGAIEEIIDPQGARLVFHYGPATEGGRRLLQAVDTPAGRFTYAQDDAQRLSTVRAPDALARHYRYAAGASPWLTGIVEQRPGEASRTLRSWAYDTRGRAVLSVHGDPSSRRERVEVSYRRDGATVRNADGTQTTFAFAQAGGRPVITSIKGPPCVGCAAPGKASHDDRGWVTQVDGLTVTRDVLGRMTAWREPEGTGRVQWLADSTLPAQVALPSEVPGRQRVLAVDWHRFTDPVTGLWRAVPQRLRENGWRDVDGRVSPISREWTLDWRIDRGVATAQRVTRPVSSASIGPQTAGVPGWPGLRWKRDDFGLPLDARGASAGNESRRYDTEGRLLTRRFADGASWTYRYDERGRLVGHRAEQGDQAIDVSVRWAGDRPVAVSHPAEALTLATDEQGRTVRTIARPVAELAGGMLRYRESVQRDEAGRVVQHVLPEGGQLDYVWQDDLLLRVTYTAPGQKPVSLFQQWAGRERTARRWFNGVQGTLLPHRGVQIRAPRQVLPSDQDGLTGLLRHFLLPDQIGNSSPLQPDSRAQTDTSSRVLLAHLRMPDERGRPGADLDVLDGTAAPYVARQYGYDASSRLIVVDERAGTHAVPATWKAAAPRFLAWREGGDTAAVAMSGMSPRVMRTRNASGLPQRVGGNVLSYSPSRRLTMVSRDGKAVARYAHNAFGERIVRHVDGKASHDFYLDMRLVAEQGEGPVGTIARRYVYAGLEPVAVIDYPGGRAVDGSGDGEIRVLAVHADLGLLPRVVTDADGAVRWRARYDAFGALTAQTGDTPMRLRWPGQVADPETGWHDNYLRTYDPVAGDYLEPDPLGAEPGTSAYGYAGQQPGRFHDPLGLLLFAFDGTQNNPSSRTNILMLSQLYAYGPENTQQVFYVDGPGSQEGANNFSERWGDTIYGHTTRERLDTQWASLLRALENLPADSGPVDIDVIGFSRGAAAARAFANRLSTSTENGRFSGVRKGSGKTISACVNLRFLGVFDTVPQMLVGLTDPLWDFTIGAGWDLVAHAVALSERRMLFPLTTMEGGALSPVIEMGFLGAHSDLGGGYLYERDGKEMGDLSDVSFNWMLAQAQSVGVTFRNIPTARRTVSDPSIHRQPNYGYLGHPHLEDRAVNNAKSERLVDAQHEHPLYGKSLRDQLAPFITGLPQFAETPTGAVVQVVRMHAYLNWLRSNRDMGFLQ